jgi:hypothetical protein
MGIMRKRRLAKLYSRLRAMGITIDEPPTETLPWLRYISGLVCCLLFAIGALLLVWQP